MRRKLVPAVVLLAGVAALLAFPALADRFYLQLVSKIMIMAIFAMSLNLLVGCTGLVSLGHAAFFGVGAYTLMLLSPHRRGAGWCLSRPAPPAPPPPGASATGFLFRPSPGFFFI